MNSLRSPLTCSGFYSLKLIAIKMIICNVKFHLIFCKTNFHYCAIEGWILLLQLSNIIFLLKNKLKSVAKIIQCTYNVLLNRKTFAILFSCPDCNLWVALERGKHMKKNEMRAVIFESEGVVRCVKKPIPKIRSKDEVLLKILAASVCGSDLGITAVPPKHFGKPGVILGHECIAEIAELGEENPEFKVGDRVLVNPMIPCYDCYQCKIGQFNMCENVGSVGEDCDGVFAEYFVCKRSLLFHLSDNVPVDVAVFAEPLACAMNGFKRLRFMPGESVLIYGAGPLGIMFAKLFKASGAGFVMMTEVAPFRRQFAIEHSGADCVIDPQVQKAKDVLFEKTGQKGADNVIDTVGSLLASAIDDVAVEGKILLFGINDRATQTIKQYDLIRKEVCIVTSYATHLTFPYVSKMLAGNLLDLLPLLTTRVTLEELPEGIEKLRRGEFMKVVVYPQKA